MIRKKIVMGFCPMQKFNDENDRTVSPFIVELFENSGAEIDCN